MPVNLLKNGALIFLFMLFQFTFSEESSVDNASMASSTDDLMEMSLEDLMNVTVTTTSKTEEKLSDAPGVISVVTRDEMERFGARSLRDVLMRMPSVNLSAFYMTDRSAVTIRGIQYSSPNHILLLINGRPVREALEAGIKGETLESFPVAAIEKIELIRGPGSVIYGSNAFSGVINVITKGAEENKTQVSVHGGMPGSVKTSNSVAYKIGDLGIVAGGQYNYTENWELTFQSQDDLFTDFSIPDNGYGSYLELSFKNITYMTSYNHWQNHYAMQKYMPPPPAPVFAGVHAYGEGSWEKWFNDLGYKQAINKMWDMEFNLTYTQSWLTVDSFPAPHRNSYDLTGEWTNYIHPTKSLNFLIGFSGNKVEGTEESGFPTNLTTTIDDAQYRYSGFIQADYKIISQLKLLAGIQANKADGIELDINPRLGLIWAPADIVNVKALYSNAFRAPSMFELYLDHPTLQGTDDLDPEKIKTIDLGVNIQTDRISFGINNFYSRVEQVIWQKQNAAPPHEFANQEVATTFFGGELEFKYFITKELMLLGSGMYQKNNTKGLEGNAMPVPETTGKVGISYASKGLTASAFNIFEGKLHERYNASYNKTREAFNLLNVNAKYEISRLLKLNGPVITLDLEAYNLLDEEVWLPAGGQATNYTLPEVQGASYYGGLTVKF